MDRPENRTGRAKTPENEKNQKEFDIDRKRDDDLNVDYETLKNGTPKVITKFEKNIQIPYKMGQNEIQWSNEGELQIKINK